MHIKSLLDTTLNQAWDELMGAKFYYDLYEEYKIDMPNNAKVFIEIAPIELSHFDKLMNAFDILMETMKETEKELKMVWEYEKKRLMKYSREIKNEISNARF